MQEAHPQGFRMLLSDRLALALTDWDTPPGPLVPLYLRRPDAMTLAERGAQGPRR